MLRHHLEDEGGIRSVAPITFNRIRPNSLNSVFRPKLQNFVMLIMCPSGQKDVQYMSLYEMMTYRSFGALSIVSLNRDQSRNDFPSLSMF